MRLSRWMIGAGAVIAAGSVASVAVAQEVGKASAVNPAATANLRTISIGQSIAHKERIKTTDKGSVQILFIDKTSMTVGPNSDLTIDEYVYDPNAGTGKLAARLGKGALRFVGGQISHTGDAEIKTASATVGIRGGVAMIGPGFVFAGYGSSTVTTQGGTVTLGAGEFTQTPGGGQPPSPPAPPPPNFVQSLIQSFQSAPGQSGGAGQGTASRGNVQRAEARATGSPNGAVAGSLTPQPPPTPLPAINQVASSLNQTIQTSTQQAAVQRVERPTKTLVGFVGGLMTSLLTNYSTYQSASVGTLEGTLTGAVDGRGLVNAEATGSVTQSPGSSGYLPGSFTYRYDTQGGYYVAEPAKDANGQPTSTIDHMPIYDQSGFAVMLSGAAAQQYGDAIRPGLTVCSCDYTKWGLWQSSSQQTVAGSNYQHVAIGYWVAGRPTSAGEVPLSGSASYVGHVIGFDNSSGNVAGNLTTSVNFATRTGSVAVAGFGGVDYSGSLALSASDPRNITASLTGLGRTMNLNGSFFRGVASPVGEMGGNVSISGPSYIGAGIFAAKMQ
ncbi:FecR family protein [Rhodopseudomonas parapalustris]